MLTKVIEVYEENVKSNSALERNKHYKMREALLNFDYVVCVTEDLEFKEKVIESGAFPELNKNAIFLRATVNKGNFGSDIFISGDLNTLYKTFNEKENKKVLKG
jgi:hypothetical protein